MPDQAIAQQGIHTRGYRIHYNPLCGFLFVLEDGSGSLGLSFKTVPKSKVHICILYIYILVVSLFPRLGEPLAHPLKLWFLHVCVCYLPIT
jgi:hypothetical protein